MSFDTLRAARRLKEAGATDPVAETIREAREFDLAQLATKADIAQLATKAEIADLRTEIAGLRTEIAGFRTEIAMIETRRIKWVIGTGIAAVIAVTRIIWAATQVILHAHP